MTTASLRTAVLALAAFGLAPVLLFATPASLRAEEPVAIAPENKAAIEEIIRNYILEHPEVVDEALQKLEQREQAQAAAQQKQAIRQAGEALRHDPDSPVIGNPEGDVVIVEFFDYRCPYCKQVAESLRKVVKEDGKIRLVMKELPILSQESYLAATAALAAHAQGRYEDFHFALMTEPGTLSEETVFAVAEDLGLDLDRLRADMGSPKIARALEEVYALAQKIGVRGTPAFVIGEEFIPGAISIEAMKEKVAAARDDAS